MFEQLFNTNIFIYSMIGLCGLGFLIKFILRVVYKTLIKASSRMGVSKNKLARDMKYKFEVYHNLQIGVNNVDIFVDKCLHNYKFCGILLSTWESFCGQLLLGCVLIGSITTILGIVYECGKNQILGTLAIGIITSGLLIFFESIFNFGEKRERVRLNIINYLENVLKVKLEKGEIQVDLFERYALDVREFEGSGELKQDPIYSAAAKERKVKRGTFVTPTIRENRKERKKKLRQASIRNRLQIKQDKKNEKAAIKHATKHAKEKEKEIKKILKQQKLAEKHAMKNKKRLEIEELRKASLLEEIRKEEEKRTEEELKRVLSLEKALEKNKLNERIQGSNSIRGLDDDKGIRVERKDIAIKDEGSSKTMIEVVPLGEVVSQELEEAKKEIAATTESSKVELDPRKKEHIRNMIDYRIKQGNSSSDNLLEDILNELFQ